MQYHVVLLHARRQLPYRLTAPTLGDNGTVTLAQLDECLPDMLIKTAGVPFIFAARLDYFIR